MSETSEERDADDRRPAVARAGNLPQTPDAPEADVAEQNRPLDDEPEESPWPEDLPLEADPADTADQNRTYADDEDDYR
ncbi:hypothetical protein [Herbidospora yilanensis]|uniref:hypothetical protein n=1 Tax=Herbidospora yilanensis TaxID=354426 RepID=UPI000AE4801C|nr:hypothetical protein [Herbidospora yilanensis]